MKKISKLLVSIIALCIMTNIIPNQNNVYGQIGNIKPEKTTKHTISPFLWLWDNKCYLRVSSDNMYEKRRYHILLGSTYKEVITSLNNLIQACKQLDNKAKKTLTLTGYRVTYHSPNTFIVTPRNGFETGAGDYIITITNMQTAIKTFQQYVNNQLQDKPSEFNEKW